MAGIDDTLSPRERAFWLQRRQALLIELASIEEYLGLKRSVPPKHQRGPALTEPGACRDGEDLGRQDGAALASA